MPCRVDDITPLEREIQNQIERELTELLDNIEYSLDVLREWLINDVGSLGFHLNQAYEYQLTRIKKRVNPWAPPNPALLAQCEEHVREYNKVNGYAIDVLNGGSLEWHQLHSLIDEQIKHRQKDMVRLARHWLDEDDFEKASAAINCDATKPLAEQLGYDPNSY